MTAGHGNDPCPIAVNLVAPSPRSGRLRSDAFGPYWLVVPVQPEPSEVMPKLVYLGQQAVDHFGVEASVHVAVMVEEAVLQQGYFSRHGRPLGER